MDTTPPVFVGTDIGLSISGNHLVANWSVASFIDGDNPFSLDYEYSIGKYELICFLSNKCIHV